MRPWSVVPFSLALAGTAFAQDTESVANVTFEAEQVLFRGTDQVISYPPANPSDPPDVRLELRADVTADSEMSMDANSRIDWPEAFVQSWEGVPGGGEVTFDVGLAVRALVVVDTTIFSVPINFSYNLWDNGQQTNSWSGVKFFDSLLLPGSSMPSLTVFLDNTAVPAWELGQNTEVIWIPDPLFSGQQAEVRLHYDLQIQPDFSMTISGTKVTTRGREITTHNGTVVVPAPTSNNGTATLDSVWLGTVTSRFALDIDPILDIEYFGTDGNSDWESPFLTNYLDGVIQPWEIATDTRAYTTKNTPYEHDLPAIDVDPSRLDFGRVLIGDEAQLNLVVEDLGVIDLVGDVDIDGDGFSISRPDLDIEGEDEVTLVVTFAPEESGEFEGEITLTTNDPIRPSITIPIEGEGYEEGDTDTGTDTDTDTEPGRRGCGCAIEGVAPMAGFVPFVPAVALLFARRRRS